MFPSNVLISTWRFSLSFSLRSLHVVMSLFECCACLLCVCMACPLPGLHGVGEMVWIRSSLGSPWSCLMSSWINTPHFHSTMYISIIELYCDFTVDLFCTLDIYFLFVRRGRGIPPLLLFLMVSFIFFPDKGFFLIRVEGLRTEGVVCCTDCKAP